VIDDFLPRQADAVVGHRKRPRSPIVAHTYAELRIALNERAVGQALEPQLVAGIGCVRDELAQKDLLVAVQGVDHQMQELLDFGLKTERFFRRCDGHVVDPSQWLPAWREIPTIDERHGGFNASR